MNTASEWIESRFGRKKGLARYVWHQSLYRTGLLRIGRAEPGPGIRRLVFVCQGNICRSPFGEAVARKYGWETWSFGLETEAGHPAEPAGVEVAMEYGLDLGPHRSRPVDSYRPAEGDLLLGMEVWHLRRLERRFPDTPATLTGLVHPSRRVHLEDPFGLSRAWFRSCFEIIHGAVEAISLRRERWE